MGAPAAVKYGLNRNYAASWRRAHTDTSETTTDANFIIKLSSLLLLCGLSFSPKTATSVSWVFELVKRKEMRAAMKKAKR